MQLRVITYDPDFYESAFATCDWTVKHFESDIVFGVGQLRAVNSN